MNIICKGYFVMVCFLSLRKRYDMGILTVHVADTILQTEC